LGQFKLWRYLRLGYDTHSTVDRGGEIKSEHVKDCGNDGAHPCQGVNPYCPPARTVPSDDAPFIIESDEEFPDENAIHEVPELHQRHCQRRVQWTIWVVELG
jgi:hypothetical protein